MYQLKQLPKDFVVIEIPAVQTLEKGHYAYFWIKKRDLNTLDVVRQIAKELRIKEKEIGFAGSKDKHAVTEQLISIAGKKKEEVEKIRSPHFTLQWYGYGNKPISLGDLQGNKFEIVIRNLEEEKIEKIQYLENYFDEQRFSEHNLEIGRHLLKKEFKQAVSLLDELSVAKYCKEKPTDAVGALKLLPLRQLRMYVNAYQSYLWNKTVAEILNRKGKIIEIIPYSAGKLTFIDQPETLKDLKIPLIGFSEEKVSEEIQNIIDKIMEEENISYADFIIKQIPEITLEGELRNAVVLVADLQIGKETSDELNQGKKKVKVSFALPKGSYATMVIKRIMLSSA